MEERRTVRRRELEQRYSRMLNENPKLLDNPYFKFKYDLFREFEDDRHRAPRPVILNPFKSKEEAESKDREKIEDRSDPKEE